MMRRNVVIGAGMIVVAAILAFPLREAVIPLLLVPLAYLLWLLKIIYLSLHQSVWWFLVALITLLILVQSLLPKFKPIAKFIRHERRQRGNVEELAIAIKKTEKGIYFKWLVANRLGKLAYQALLLHEHGKPRSVFAPLQSDGWNPPKDIQNYLEKGLHGSFADFPNSNWNYFSAPQKTPLDQNVEEVVEFLESKLKTDHQ
jgi:hypothetical protein